MRWGPVTAKLAEKCRERGDIEVKAKDNWFPGAGYGAGIERCIFCIARSFFLFVSLFWVLGFV